MDVDRHIFYDFSSKGFIHTFDLVDTNTSFLSYIGR